MKSFLFLSLVFFNLALKAEIIELKLKSDSPSCKGLSQVLITQDKTVLYQLEVPMNGTGQVHLLTGNYQVDATNKDGCSFQDIIQITDLPNKPLEIKLNSTPRKPTAAEAMPNSSPCGWGTFGCSGNLYPHSGNIALARPNFYFSGKDEGKFKLKFTGESFDLLGSVPNFKEKEISGELRKGSVYNDNTWYPYISYSARIDDGHFQNTNGFCGTKKEMYEFVLEGLKKYEFPNEARTDFIKSWSAKIPEAARYCVYPQVNAQLDKAAPLEITFDDKTQVRTERIFYLMVPQYYKGKRIPTDANKYADKPKTIWKNYSRTVIPKTTYLYEWGIGFIFE
ncbi:hypothetical protein CIK05_02395 [Bdellovibrio sp. qaytius]|nr:hypothetical protein CIK05_02395 [Bdellovibrio sp. qaytius]